MSIETLNEFLETFQELGWLTYKSKNGELFCETRISEKLRISGLLLWRDFRIFDNDFSYDGYIKFGVWPSLQHDALDKIYTIISNEKKRISENCILMLHNDKQFKVDKLESDIIIDILQDIRFWALSVNVDAALSSLRKLSTDCIGDMPMRHLAALAEAGEVDQLRHYQNCFASGDRLGFVPYITSEYIDRALECATCRRADPLWLPKTPRLRI